MNHTITFRVRYGEVDSMRVVHHSRMVQYFEMGRIELLRHLGISYRDVEAQDAFFAVIRLEVRYRAPAYYDDLLSLTTTITKQGIVRYDHSYVLKRDQTVIADGTTTIACVDGHGKPRAIPEVMTRAHGKTRAS